MLGQIKIELQNSWGLKDLIDVEQLFKGVKTKPFDVEDTLNEIAYEAAWPEGDPSGDLKDYVPNELGDLASEIESLDESDSDYEERVASVRMKLQDIQSGNYTVYADISYNGGDYMFAEDEEVTIHLSAEKARGILYNYCDNDNISKDSLFDGIDYEDTNEDDVQDLVDKEDFSGYAEGATGTCEAFDRYKEAWCQFIYAICNGDVNEDNFDDCITFFEETDFEDEDESDFENWLEEHNEEDEDEE